MLKKLLSIMTAVLMLTSCIGADTIFADEDIVSEIFTIEETGVSKTNPDAVKPTDTYFEEENIWWVTGGSSGEETTYYVAKFDLSGYVLPVKSVEFEIAFINNGYGPSKIYTVRGNWSADSLTYNSLMSLAGGSLGTAKSVDWHNGISATNTQPAYTGSGVDLTAQVNEVINDTSSADKFLTVVVGRPVAGKSLRAKNGGVSKLTIIQSEPAYNVPSEEITVKCSDSGMIENSSKDAPGTLSSNTYYVTLRGTTTDTTFDDPYGVEDAVYFKFDTSTVRSDIESATLYFKQSSMRAWNMRVYPVVNDSWTRSTLTFNSAYGVEADETNGIAAQPALYQPTNSFVGVGGTATTTTNSPQVYAEVQVDVTDMVKSLTADDDYVSLAVMLNTLQWGASRNIYFNVSEANAPKLVITTKASTVTAGEPVFKVNDTVTDTLSDGVISAEVEITSTMSAPTTTTMIMAIYDNDELVKLYISKPQKINEKSINNGITNLTITSNEEITVGANARASVFMWKDISTPSPLGTVKTIATK